MRHQPDSQKLRWLLALACLLLLGGLSVSAPRRDVISSALPNGTNVETETTQSPQRRVYIPHNVTQTEATVFWFGRVTPSENYTDVRIRYTDKGVLVNLGIIDRQLWYHPNPAPSEITSWDAVSLYLRPGGATGAAPDATSYRFDAQLSWGGGDRTPYQAAYRGNGSQWALTPVPFMTAADWNSTTAPNNNRDAHGWMLWYEIPFASLGLSGPPAQGTVWGLAVAVHDRDSQAGPPLAPQIWPETMLSTRPATWGELVFGLKPAYVPASAQPQGTAVIRHGLNGARVIDADVGGSSMCGSAASSNYFQGWGELNYAGKEFLNVQRVDPISEWPCFSKYYVIFPLDSVPEGKVVLSASLTLYQSGHAGGNDSPGPQPSLIQVFSIYEDWNESTLTWNNAPLAGDLVASARVNPLDSVPPPWPGIPRKWDVGGAVAEAHATRQPLRLALYSADGSHHSGKYFFSSNIGGDGAGRPTLTVVWGDEGATLTKVVLPRAAALGDMLAYTLHITGDGEQLDLTDILPAGVSAPIALSYTGTSVTPIYDSSNHRLTWSDAPSTGTRVTISYQTRVTARDGAALTNVAVLRGPAGLINEASVTVMANPQRIALPLIIKNR
jgi:hypothetical protein